MSGFGRVLAVFLYLCACSGGLSLGAATAEEAVPASGAFVTLERERGGALKYASTKAGGNFTIKSLSKGRYRMSITPPKRDQNAQFKLAVRGEFEGIRVIVGGNVVSGDEKAGSKKGSTLHIPPSIWRQKAIWLDVEISLEDVSGRFVYVLNDRPDSDTAIVN